mgnify:CR=1 FL=1
MSIVHLVCLSVQWFALLESRDKTGNEVQFSSNNGNDLGKDIDQMSRNMKVESLSLSLSLSLCLLYCWWSLSCQMSPNREVERYNFFLSSLLLLVFSWLSISVSFPLTIFFLYHTFIIVGARTVRCLPTGKWSDIIPSCKQITCPNIHSIIKVGNIFFCSLIYL